jgi:uncharacterized protein YaiI (UPF0178 family)
MVTSGPRQGLPVSGHRQHLTIHLGNSAGIAVPKKQMTAINQDDKVVRIWVDADACPAVIKEILFRAAARTQTTVTLVANQFINTPNSKFVDFVQVSKGFDIADNEIVKRCQAGDLVVTSDIPLADEVISKGGLALSPRGELFTTENIKARLNIRDFMETMRSSGLQTGGPPTLSANDRQAFGNQLDRWLARNRVPGRPGNRGRFK